MAGAFLCSDGRGEAVVFEVHLPNASPVGDPSPVVTKVRNSFYLFLDVCCSKGEREREGERRKER